MKRTACFIFLSCFFLLNAPVVSGLPFGRGITYFNQSIGARSLGLGGTLVTAGEDGTFSFSNPAGLAGLQGSYFSIDSQNMAFMQAFLAGQGSLGIGLSSHNAKDAGSSLSFSNTYASFVYAQKLELFTLGANLKYILSEEFKEGTSPIRTGSGWDLDLGIASQMNSWLKSGLYVQNIVPYSMGARNIWNNGSSESISMSVRAGAGVKLFGRDSLLGRPDLRKMQLFIDAEMNSMLILLGHLGLEWEAGELWTLRAGLDQQLRDNRTSSVFTFGAGTSFDKWSADAGIDPLSSTSPAVTLYFVPAETRKTASATEFPSLTITSPSDNYATDEAFVIVSGSAKQVRVRINGLDVFVKPDSSFSASIPLYTGKNLIEITGIGEANRKIQVQRRILRKARILVQKEMKLEQKKSEIERTQESILRRELAIASLEADPLLTAQEKARLEREKARISERKASVAKEKEKVETEVKAVQEKKEKVSALATLGVIQTKEDAPYDIDQKITRAELAMWLVKAKSIPVYSVPADPYPDVKKDHWAAAFIQAAVSKGLMAPYPDGLFRPEDGVKEAEGINALRKFDKIK